ncbi:hypothetical protein HAX54_044687, partial [Datura stramonium]|nr:hypothetical protein [Datura stramonium]
KNKISLKGPDDGFEFILSIFTSILCKSFQPSDDSLNLSQGGGSTSLSLLGLTSKSIGVENGGTWAHRAGPCASPPARRAAPCTRLPAHCAAPCAYAHVDPCRRAYAYVTLRPTCCRSTSEANSCWATSIPYYFTSG